MKTRMLACLVLFGCFSCQKCKPCKKSERTFKWEIPSFFPHQIGRLSKRSYRIAMIRNETRFYTNLSNAFNFRLTVFNNNSNPYPTRTVLKVYKKSGVLIQKIELANNLMFPLDLKEVYSFETRVNLPFFKGQDNLYGTMIIEDFNFDQLYDIALMGGCAVNGNAWYSFYIQTTDSTFVKNDFLSQVLSTYPAYRNVREKKLSSNHFSFLSNRITTVQYNDSLKKWKKISEVIKE